MVRRTPSVTVACVYTALLYRFQCRHSLSLQSISSHGNSVPSARPERAACNPCLWNSAASSGLLVNADDTLPKATESLKLAPISVALAADLQDPGCRGKASNRKHFRENLWKSFLGEQRTPTQCTGGEHLGIKIVPLRMLQYQLSLTAPLHNT